MQPICRCGGSVTGVVVQKFLGATVSIRMALAPVHDLAFPLNHHSDAGEVCIRVSA